MMKIAQLPWWFVVVLSNLAPGNALTATRKLSNNARGRFSHTVLHEAKEAGSIDARRKILFGRKGPHFSLDRSTGRIEFGDTVKLVSLNDGKSKDTSAELLNDWLQDTDEFAMAMWRPDKLSKQQSSHSSKTVPTYRLILLPVQFVMLHFEPWVELQVKTVADSRKQPVFTLQSIGYSPNPTQITFVPGMPSTLTLDDVVENLDIDIEVVGQIRQRQPADTNNGGFLSGTMVYQVTGKLPSALLLFPDPLLKAAAETLNKEVVQYAKQAFVTGTTAGFQKRSQSKLQQTTQSRQ